MVKVKGFPPPVCKFLLSAFSISFLGARESHMALHRGKTVGFLFKITVQKLSPNASKFGTEQKQPFCYICAKFGSELSFNFIVIIFVFSPNLSIVLVDSCTQNIWCDSHHTIISHEVWKVSLFQNVMYLV